MYASFMFITSFEHIQYMEGKVDMEMVGIDRTSSIEREPKTLSFHQLQIARDLAIYVLNTYSMEEALRIFTEGLEPVGRRSTRMDMEGGEEEEDDQLLKDTAAPEAPTIFKSIASAPF